MGLGVCVVSSEWCCTFGFSFLLMKWYKGLLWVQEKKERDEKQQQHSPDATMKTYQGYLPSGFQQSALTSSAEEPRRTSTSIHWPPELLGKALEEEEVMPGFMNGTLPGYDADQRHIPPLKRKWWTQSKSKVCHQIIQRQQGLTQVKWRGGSSTYLQATAIIFPLFGLHSTALTSVWWSLVKMHGSLASVREISHCYVVQLSWRIGFSS